MTEFNCNNYTGIKKKIAISLDCYHQQVRIDPEGTITRGIVLEDFDECIIALYNDIMDIIEIVKETKD